MRPCDFCKGQRVVQSPAGILQRCPICDGTGTQPPVEQFFEYDLAVALTANQANVAGVITIFDADFKWIELIGTSTGVFAATITDGGTKQAFMNEAVHSANLFGTAQLPFRLEVPHVFKRNSSIQLSLTDLSGAPNTVRATFKGVQLIG